jgi:PIN domain nuclease of toxin-antitoxin system
MKFLLDTCIFLWYVNDDKKLNKKHLDLITDYHNEIYLSVVSVWETCIKQLNKKLILPEFAGDYLPKIRIKHGILSLELSEKCLEHLDKLPSIHQDPFDRILICQAIENDLTFLTVDKNIKKYPIKTK